MYPITITNTNSVGTVRDAVIEWGRTRLADVFNCCLPVVAETWDGDLNDIYGFHVTKEHVFRRPGERAAGSGSRGERRRRDRHDLPRLQGRDRHREPAARRPRQGGYTVGVLVQCNFGLRRLLRIAGVPVGQEITEPRDCYEGTDLDSAQAAQRCPAAATEASRSRARSSS